MSDFTVYKRDHQGREVWHYGGTVIERGPNFVCIRARFASRDVVDVGALIFRRGDLMTEWFYNDRYYNVFMVQDGDGPVKGWYCNITRPAHITADSAASDDLALDVVVDSDGRITLLDEDEFAALDLPEAERQAALNAVADIRRAVTAREGPFAALR